MASLDIRFSELEELLIFLEVIFEVINASF